MVVYLQLREGRYYSDVHTSLHCLTHNHLHAMYIGKKYILNVEICHTTTTQSLNRSRKFHKHAPSKERSLMTYTQIHSQVSIHFMRVSVQTLRCTFFKAQSLPRIADLACTVVASLRLDAGPRSLRLGLCHVAPTYKIYSFCSFSWSCHLQFSRNEQCRI